MVQRTARARALAVNPTDEGVPFAREQEIAIFFPLRSPRFERERGRGDSIESVWHASARIPPRFIGRCPRNFESRQQCVTARDQSRDTCIVINIRDASRA